MSNENPTPEFKSERFGHGIWFALQAWPALTVAIQSQFGGPDGADKRDWLAGAITEIFENDPETDQLDIETVLLQVMEDEFEVRLEDDSEVAVAATIVKIKNEISNNVFETVDAMEHRWRKRRGKGPNLANVEVVQEGTQDASGSDDDDDDYEDDDDMDMGEAPQLVPAPPKEKVEPEVDEDGFTKVVGKKRR
ncbi:putative pre-rrna processing protein [Lasiodiplodia theobromae]|uniref:Pre-rRNA-processing protein TSR2 n=1 Tax=Lasiodiplodia theobromae TaxID=45133 RepID=A0A5N5D0Q4_9PEZI|nr:Pre-rRNA-processing protein tsr2 [Lasiodiplodia theobromae]KAB2571233.1 Pre-rRNA-processing protein TSR2 [Lasiodiplodia theobromae]KAF4543293.1 Pre-rRNA-processing protein tsr2 [Lasiodiplodia theobromae]KAF9636447.1 putative pre-rrna processing protein [Lasiodiplodia theobromae]